MAGADATVCVRLLSIHIWPRSRQIYRCISFNRDCRSFYAEIQIIFGTVCGGCCLAPVQLRQNHAVVPFTYVTEENNGFTVCKKKGHYKRTVKDSKKEMPFFVLKRNDESDAKNAKNRIFERSLGGSVCGWAWVKYCPPWVNYCSSPLPPPSLHPVEQGHRSPAQGLVNRQLMTNSITQTVLL